MTRIRIERLLSDERDLDAFVARGWSRHVQILERSGQPPSSYQLRLLVPGVERLAARTEREGVTVKGPFVLRHHHDVRVTMGEAYPLRPPQVTFLDTHLHPNIYGNGRLCWGLADDASWWRGGDSLGTLVERLVHLVVGVPDCTNPRSPANPEAVRPYVENAALFPLLAIAAQPEQPRQRPRFRELTP
jgi:hypothetical protein